MLTREEIAKLSDNRLLFKVAEEASEVIKAVMKHASYGARPFAGGVQYDNTADAVLEYAELQDLMSEYQRRFIRPEVRVSHCGETDCTFQDGWCKCGMKG